MNDLDSIRAFRADVPYPTSEQLRAGRERLLAMAVAAPAVRAGRRRVRIARRLAVSAALAAAGAAAVLTVLAPQQPQPTARVSLASAVLSRAAATRGRQLPQEPAARQWIYQYDVDETLGSPVQRSASWERFDGRETAAVARGRVVVYNERGVHAASGDPLEAYVADATPMSTYAALASLPSDPRALLARIDSALASGHYDGNGLPAFDAVPMHTTAQREFEFIAQLLWQDSQSGVNRAGANIFRALAALPDVAAEDGLTDALGRPAVGLSDDGGAFQLLLSPRNYDVLGFRSVSTGSAPRLPNGGAAPKGTLVQSIANSERLVKAPGER